MSSAPKRTTLTQLPLGVRVAAIAALLILVWLWPRIEAWLAPRGGAQPPDVTGPLVIEPGSGSPSNPGDAGTAEAAEPVAPESETPPRTETVETKVAKTEEPRLREIRRNVFQSTAGLVYLPGSADGHRLDHVLRHATDDPGKPVHGVFEGDRETVLAAIDEAFESAQQSGSHVRRRNERDRQVITVNMKRRVGYSGGESGSRNGNPECRFIRLVLENDNEVVTAYPVSGF
jgi:hypothetical protein